MSEQLIQGTNEWRMARVGSLGASRLHEAIARTKTGWGASRANLMAELIAERLSGLPYERYQSAEMKWGAEHEADACSAYEFYLDCEVRPCGLYKHPNIAGTHASPDRLIGDHGLLEVKAPNSATHIDTLLGDAIPTKYITQMMWQMACTRRHWCDYCSFDPRMPDALRLFVQRVQRDDKMIAELEAAVKLFLAELDTKLVQLQGKMLKVA